MKMGTRSRMHILLFSAVALLCMLQQCEAKNRIEEGFVSYYKPEAEAVMQHNHPINRRSADEDSFAETSDEYENNDSVPEEGSESFETDQDNGGLVETTEDHSHHHNHDHHGQNIHHNHNQQHIHHNAVTPSPPVERKGDIQDDNQEGSKGIMNENVLPTPQDHLKPVESDVHVYIGSGIVVVMVVLALVIMVFLNNYRKKIRDQIQYGA